MQHNDGKQSEFAAVCIWAFYLCAIIKDQSDLHIIEILKSSSVPLSEVSFTYFRQFYQ